MSSNDSVGRIIRRSIAAADAGAVEVVWRGGRGTIANLSTAAYDQVVTGRFDLVDVTRERGAVWRWRVRSGAPGHVDAVGVQTGTTPGCTLHGDVGDDSVEDGLPSIERQAVPGGTDRPRVTETDQR